MTMTDPYPSDDATIVIPPVHDDPPEPQPAPPPIPSMEIPDINSPMSVILTGLASLAALAGDPVSVDVSYLLKEATITLATRERFDAWCLQLGAQDHPATRQDALGAMAVMTVGSQLAGYWSFRIFHHSRTTA
jgi:hypothetical protein